MWEEKCGGTKCYNCIFSDTFFVVCYVSIAFWYLEEEFILCLLSVAVNWSTFSFRSLNILKNFDLTSVNADHLTDPDMLSPLSYVLWIPSYPGSFGWMALLPSDWDEQMREMLLSILLSPSKKWKTWKKSNTYHIVTKPSVVAKKVVAVLSTSSSVIVGAIMFPLLFTFPQAAWPWCCLCTLPGSYWLLWSASLA